MCPPSPVQAKASRGRGDHGKEGYGALVAPVRLCVQMFELESRKGHEPGASE